MFSNRRRRKAMVEAKIVTLILLIVSFILLFGFLYKLYDKQWGHANEEACRSSLILTDVLAKKMNVGSIEAGEYAKPWPITCKTKDKEIKTDDPEKAKKELAELMSWCWWTMGEGSMKPFDKDLWLGKQKCFVCYTARFPNLKTPITQQDFMFYLQDKSKKGIKYYDYLKYSEDKFLQTPLTDPIDNIRTYAVIYTSPADPSFGYWGGCLLTVAGSGAAIGTVIGPVGTLGGTVAGAGTGIVMCGAGLVATYIESKKDDLVYVVDINRGESGCYGGYSRQIEVKSA